MKNLFVILSLSIVTFIASAQTPVNHVSDKGCKFLDSLHFIKGKAIVKTEAIYRELYEDAPLSAMRGFEKHKKLLNTVIYSGSVFSFTPKGCSTKYSAPFVANQSCCSFKIGSTVYLTCIVFKDYKGYDSKYFLVVKNLSLTDPNKKATSK